MEINQANLHPRALKNQRFIKAVDYLITEKKVGNQKDLANLTKISEATISNIRNDKKLVSDSTINKLLDAFPGLFNPEYFRGRNIYMLLSDSIDARIWAEEKRQAAEPQPAPAPSIDPSSMVNAIIASHAEALAAKDETIASLKRELQTKDDIIQALREQIATKDQLIAEQKARLIEYRRIIDSRDSTLTNYPFPFGAADSDRPAKNAHPSTVSPNS